MKTWHFETAVVCLILLTSTILLTPGRITDWLAMVAVMASWGHMSVASRLEEAQQSQQVSQINCAAWLQRYLLAKESLWTLTFILSGIYPPLVGSALFFLYPFWRRWWRSRSSA